VVAAFVEASAAWRCTVGLLEIVGFYGYGVGIGTLCEERSDDFFTPSCFVNIGCQC
jgi:hypothetical protein